MGKVLELNEADFDAVVLKSEIPVLLDFWSPTCMPCRVVAPILEDLAEDFEGEAKIVKINVFENVNIAGHLGISSLPTLIIYHQGKMVERLVGAQSRDKLEELLEEYV